MMDTFSAERCSGRAGVLYLTIIRSIKKRFSTSTQTPPLDCVAILVIFGDYAYALSVPVLRAVGR